MISGPVAAYAAITWNSCGSTHRTKAKAGMLVTSTDGVSGASLAKEAAAPAPSTLERDVQTLEKAIYEVKRVIVGQDRLVERLLVGVLARGHVLLEGVPVSPKPLR